MAPRPTTRTSGVTDMARSSPITCYFSAGPRDPNRPLRSSCRLLTRLHPRMAARRVAWRLSRRRTPMATVAGATGHRIRDEFLRHARDRLIRDHDHVLQAAPRGARRAPGRHHADWRLAADRRAGVH